MKLMLAALAVAAVCVPLLAAEVGTSAQPFSDVPSDHWAAPAVKRLAEQGVLKGYPDLTFRGDRPVTRYELAVALARFAEFIEAGRKPILPEEQRRSAPSQTQYLPWASDSIDFLKAGQFLPADSPVLTDGTKPVTGEDLAQALASVAARVIEIETVDPGPADVP